MGTLEQRHREHGDYGEAKPLFKVRMLPAAAVRRDYAVSPDGQRFLFGTVVNDAAASPATIVLNWRAALAD